MNTTDIALKEMYDAFAKCETNDQKVKFLKDHIDIFESVEKDYDIKWDNLIKTWSSKDPLSFWKPTVHVEDEDENKEGTKDTLDKYN